MAYIGPRNSAPLIKDSLHTPAYQVKLENVFGLTVGSNAALDCNPNTEQIAYPAGCTVVLYNPRKNRQSHVFNASRKCITCVAFSRCGRYLATGECGHAPSVRVWDLQEPNATGAVQIAEFAAHTHGVSFVVFSSSSKYLVSVGSQHDMIVNVWDWKSNLKLASNKVSSRVNAVSFSENGDYFVTVGFRHVKFWYLEYSKIAKNKEPVPLMGRSAILGEQKDNEFCDVVCGRDALADSTFAISRNGLLCEFNNRRLLDKWVEMRTTSANCMAIGGDFIFVGCAEGIVRCFSPKTLEYITTLPQTHYLGVDVSEGYNISHIKYSKPADARYPDAIALTYDSRNYKLTCVYNDHSIYVWDVRDIKRVGKSHSALYHSACIWGVDMISQSDGPLPRGTFLTCSSDDTIRFWHTNNSRTYNIYSNELMNLFYIDPEMKFIKDVDLTTNDREKSKSYDDKTGVRCVRVSPDGLHVASGDRAGNIRVHETSTGHVLCTLEAHDAEVLCLEYSDEPKLLASASRDRLIHVFRVDKNYELLQTLDDHSSSITAVRFLHAATGLQMLSCGADKSILFRQLLVERDGSQQFSRCMNVSGRCTLYDMEIDNGGRHILTACQDRNVRVYNTAQGKHTKTFRGTTADDGTLIKVALDNSGIYLATSSTDKILSVYDYYSGECMATMYGHSEIVTGLRFTPDCRYLISASGDGCIFVWRVPHDMVVTMKARLAQQRLRKSGNSASGVSGSESDSHIGTPPREIPELSDFGTPIVSDYTLDIGRLPTWAMKSLGTVVPPTETSAPEPPIRGKWAKRMYMPEKRADSDCSKESSLDSGTDTLYMEKKHPVIQVSANVGTVVDAPERIRHHTDDSSLGSFRYEDPESTEHDGDVEDISDGERTSSSERGATEQRKTYYPGNNDDDTAAKFMVNSMDVEDLHESLRRKKRAKTEPPQIEVTVPAECSFSGSDDDETSTLSGDTADRNPLSGSSESVEATGPEKCLKSVFDSLSGTAEAIDQTIVSSLTSLSSQHLSRTPARPAAAAPSPAPRFTALDPEGTRRREELNRRIRETKQQLETVGVRSNLKSSQSTNDLRGPSRSDKPHASANTRSTVNRNATKYKCMDEDNAMRRAISLSDLAVKPTPAPRTAAAAKTTSNTKFTKFVKPAPRVATTNIIRSTSATVLNNPSDSEDDRQLSRRPAFRNLGVMRPTISSMNKAAANTTRRRGPTPSHSAANLTTAVHEGSSSEAEENSRPSKATNKPAVASRPKSSKIGRKDSVRELSAKLQEVKDRLKCTTVKTGTQPGASERAPTTSATSPKSINLCRDLAQQLTLAASKVISLYKTLRDPDVVLTEADNAALLSGLEAAMKETQKVLQVSVPERAERRDDEPPSSVSSADEDFNDSVVFVDETRSKIDELVNREGARSADEAMSSIEQYSDILLNMMQSKIVSQSIIPESSQSLPPNADKQS